jgi:hypothetical protein
MTFLRLAWRDEEHFLGDSIEYCGIIEPSTCIMNITRIHSFQKDFSTRGKIKYGLSLNNFYIGQNDSDNEIQRNTEYGHDCRSLSFRNILGSDDSHCGIIHSTTALKYYKCEKS